MDLYSDQTPKLRLVPFNKQVNCMYPTYEGDCIIRGLDVESTRKDSI